MKKIFSQKLFPILVIFLLLIVGILGIKKVSAAATPTAGSTGISQAQNQSFIQALQSPNLTLESWIAGKELVNQPSAGVIPITIRALTGYLWGLYDQQGRPVAHGAGDTIYELIGTMYINKPITSVTYLANLFENIGIKQKPVYAQAATDGRSFISPVLTIWQRMRDVAYIFFVVIFVAMGFMVMFRFKINPQTVVTVQESLPKIAISLILVTLSYAISGLMVDLVFLGNSLLTQTFRTNPITGWTDTMNIGTLFGQWGTGAAGVPAACGSAKLICLIGSRLATIIPSLISGSIADLVDFILALVVVTTIFKVFFALLTKYVSIYLYTIFSPLAFMWGALPGQEDTGNKVIKGLLSSALTFPAVLFLVNLALYFMSTNFAPATFGELQPFSLGTTTVLGGGVGGVANAYQGLVALGFLMAAAGTPQAIDDILAIRGGAGVGAAEGISGAIRRLPIVGSFLG